MERRGGGGGGGGGVSFLACAFPFKVSQRLGVIFDTISVKAR